MQTAMPRLPDILCLVALALATACVHPSAGKPETDPAAAVEEDEGEPLDSEDLGPGVGWEDLMSSATDRFEPNPDIFFEDAVLTPERLAALPHPIRRAPDLAHLAVSRAIEAPSPYEDGVFGLVGGTKFFVTTRERVATFDRLYWVMIKVLSEKFGCFVTTKQQTDDQTRFTCRDRRQIVIWRSAGRNWIQFYARQYDREGYEIKVEKRRIVRLSDRQVLF